MRSLLLALALCAGPAAWAQGEAAMAPNVPAPRVLVNELHVEAGLLSGGYSFAGGSWSELFFANSTQGHYLYGGFTAEAALLSLTPLRGHGPRPSLAASVRLGYTGERWSVLGGPVLQATYPGSPIVQVLPSVRALYQVGPVLLDAGLLDKQGMVPAHVGASYGPVGLAYVLPLGARAHARLPLLSRVSLHVEGFYFRLGSARSAMFTVGVVGTPPSSRPGVAP